MQYRTLGRAGIEISALAFGAGPVSGLMVGSDVERQRIVVRYAIERGVNWFDTAATYGAGDSERNLGRALDELGVASRVHVASKVRLVKEDLHDARRAVRRSVEASLERLRLPQLTLLQLHNSITRNRDDEPTSVTPADVLDKDGILAAMEDLRRERLVLHLGLTGLGDPACLAEVIGAGEFETIQTPYHLLNPTAGHDIEPFPGDASYGNIFSACARENMGVFAIRVLAGGALAGNPPSAHTLKTPFFPAALYERDRMRAALLQQALGSRRRLAGEAVRFALCHPHIHSAIIGFADVAQIDEATAAMNCDSPPSDWQEIIEAGMQLGST
jgi:aryl-alcohol dehydrogenase-like predicted oxidoreductase